MGNNEKKYLNISFGNETSTPFVILLNLYANYVSCIHLAIFF